jgi:hypothetical protein
MLLADKDALQTQLKVEMLQIENKELEFYTQKCYTIGQQAATLAGFTFSGLVQAPWPTIALLGEPMVGLCAVSSVLCVSFLVGVVVKAVQASILGPGLALHGPEGSGRKALRMLRREADHAHVLFYHGIFWCACCVHVPYTCTHWARVDTPRPPLHRPIPTARPWQATHRFYISTAFFCVGMFYQQYLTQPHSSFIVPGICIGVIVVGMLWVSIDAVSVKTQM